jgi:PAS domain S-box-containing protein
MMIAFFRMLTINCRAWCLAAFLWTLLLAGSMFLDFRSDGRNILNLARIEALASYDKDVLYRAWAAQHGGVYVPITASTPPNPYLMDNAVRDIVTSSGLRLTLMNPAYMTRQVHELQRDLKKVSGHITSLRPIRPENAPDPWERKALETFDAGQREACEVVLIEGERHFRFMRPLMVEKSCLPCHRKHGYQEGDVRGGIGVVLPMASYDAMLKSGIRAEAAQHGVAWFTGLLGLGLGWGFARRRQDERERAIGELRRNADLRAALLQLYEMSGSAAEAEIHDCALDAAVRLTASTIGYLHRVNEDQQSIRLTTWNQAAKAECSAAYDDHYPLDKAGVWADSARTKEPVIHNDYRHVPGRKGYPEGHSHVLRHLSVPLVLDGRVTMIIGVGNKAGPYGDEDVAAVRMVASELEKIILRKQHEAQLRKLSLAVEQSPAGVLILDAHGAIEYANARFVETAGAAEDARSWLGRSFMDLPTDETAIEESCQLRASLAEGRDWRGEICIFGGNGKPVWASVSLSPLRDDRRDVQHFVAVLEDVTQSKNLEMQLRQSQKLESVGRLAGGIAHDFNNMLNVILGRVDLAQMRMEPDSPACEDLREIESAAMRSAELTRQLLAFARKQAVRPRPVDLNRAVDDMSKMIRRLLGEEIVLEWEPAENVWNILVDPSQIDQILINLLVNARDAIGGVGKILIRTANVSLSEAREGIHMEIAPGDYVELTVRDSGRGMDSQTLEHIFEPFFTTKEVGQGTGLGLAMVYGIVKQNDGYITVGSAPGEGADFRLYFPRFDVLEAVSLLTGAAPSRSRGDETILLVEDEDQILRMMRDILRKQGYRVLAARNPIEAIEIALDSGQRLDLVIADVVMPGSDGLQLWERLRATRSGLRCLFMSGYTADVLVNHGLSGAEYQFIEKPFTNTDLLAKVRLALDGHSLVS